MIRKLFATRKLAPRERFAVFAAAGTLGIFFFFRLILFPTLEAQDRLKRNVDAKRKALEEVQRFRSEYEAVLDASQSVKRQYTRRPSGFTLFAFLDQLARQTGIKDHIAYMKPSSTAAKNSAYKISTVEMKLQSISLEQLTQYLYGVETSNNMVIIKRASLSKKGKEQNTIDAVLQVETLET